MKKRTLINLGLIIAIGIPIAVFAPHATTPSTAIKDGFTPYEYVDKDGQKIYVRRDCHPTLPEIGVDERISSASVDLSEEINDETIEEVERSEIRDESLDLANKDIDTETIELNAMDDDDWELGTASAYGGYGDDDIDNNKMTATMESVNEGSYGVAVPMCWNTRENLGKTILIRYEGKVVEGVINDVGGMGNGTRTLDLQPGIFHEFGADDCNEWGLRTVEYKIID